MSLVKKSEPDGEDDIKKRQLMELAIINGTYRDTSKKSQTPNSKSETKTNSTTVDGKPANFSYSNSSILPNYVSFNNMLPQTNHDSSLLNILPSVHSSNLPNNLNSSYNSMLPILDPNLMNILTNYRSSTLDSMLPITQFAGLYNLTDVNIGPNNLLGPIRIRNMSSMMRPHPYQMMGNI